MSGAGDLHRTPVGLNDQGFSIQTGMVSRTFRAIRIFGQGEKDEDET
jgi:hypothetical protein